jgi:RNA polymerase sigma-70 factor (ECF subfamily)
LARDSHGHECGAASFGLGFDVTFERRKEVLGELTGEVVELPTLPSPIQSALDELRMIYAFIYARVGNRPDAEDLTHQVAMQAIGRLRQGAALAEVRSYLVATARTVLADFWTTRFRLLEEDLNEGSPSTSTKVDYSVSAAERVSRLLEALPVRYRRVLDLRFLHGDSSKEVAEELMCTVGAVKVLQYRALRRAAQLPEAAGGVRRA